MKRHKVEILEVRMIDRLFEQIRNTVFIRMDACVMNLAVKFRELYFQLRV